MISSELVVVVVSTHVYFADGYGFGSTLVPVSGCPLLSPKQYMGTWLETDVNCGEEYMLHTGSHIAYRIWFVSNFLMIKKN